MTMPSNVRSRRTPLPRSLLALWLCSACTPSTSKPPTPPSAAAVAEAARPSVDAALAERLAELDEVLEHQRIEAGVPGMALAIVQDGRVIHSRGYGYRDVARRLPVTERTQFAIGSSTKAFTALTVLIAAEAGAIALTDSPRKCLPYFELSDAAANEKITIRDLLIHSSGLSRTDAAWTSSPDLSPQDVIRIAGQAQAAAPLGEEFNYQNVMYAAAGECAAAALGATYEDAVEERIFAPLGMETSNLTVAQMQATPDHALGYDLVQGSDGSVEGVRQTEMISLRSVAPAGAINSNVVDMARWVRFVLDQGELDGTRLISADSFPELVKPHMKISSESGYALGWFVDSWNDKKRVHHGGNVPGFSAMVSMLPEERLGFVLLTNASNVPLRDVVGKAVFSLALDRSKADEIRSEDDAARATLPQKTARMQDLVGRYLGGSGDLEAEILVRDNEVLLDPPFYPASALVEEGDDRYTLAARPGSVTVQIRRDESGSVTGFLAKMTTRELEFERVPPDPPVRISVERLLAKVASAHGARHLRRLRSLEIRSRARFLHEGLEGEVVERRQSPNLRSETLTLQAFGKPIATVREVFDGTQAATESTSRPAVRLRGKALDDARVSSAFNPLLDHEKVFASVTIKRKTTLDGEPVYVVEKKPHKGSTITDWISAKTYRVVRRDREQSIGGGSMSFRTTQRYSDYRRVHGVLIAHRVVETNALGPQQTIVEVTSVRPNVEIPRGEFRTAEEPTAELIELARVQAPAPVGR